MRWSTILAMVALATLLAFVSVEPASAHHEHWLGPAGGKAGAQEVISGAGWKVCVNTSHTGAQNTASQAISNWESAMGWQMFDKVSCGGSFDYRVNYKDLSAYGWAGSACIAIWPYDDYSVLVVEQPGDPQCDDVIVDPDYKENLSVYSHELGHTIGLGDHYVHSNPSCQSGWVSTMNAVGCYPTPQAHDESDLEAAYTPFPEWMFWLEQNVYWVKARWGCSSVNEQYYDLERNPSGMSGQWGFVALYIPKNQCDYSNMDTMGLPPLGGEHCYRVKPWNWSLGLHGNYAPVSCIARNGSGPAVVFKEHRGLYNTAVYWAGNNSYNTITIGIYDGVWWQGGATHLKTCQNVAPGGTCEYSQGGRNPGGLASVLIQYQGDYYGDTINVN